MKKQLKYALYLCGFALCVMGFLHQHPFFSEVSQTIPATVYMDGVAVEETTVTMEGKRTNFLFSRDDHYDGSFAIAGMYRTTRENNPVEITWYTDKPFQRILYWDYASDREDETGRFMLISDDMKQFGLMRRDGAFITTSPEVLTLMEKHFAFTNTGGSRVSDFNLIPPLETLEPIPTLTEGDSEEEIEPLQEQPNQEFSMLLPDQSPLALDGQTGTFPWGYDLGDVTISDPVSADTYGSSYEVTGDGFTLQYCKFSTGEEFLTSMTITDVGIAIPRGISIGATINTLLEAYPEAVLVDTWAESGYDAIYIYEPGYVAPCKHIAFYMTNDAVGRIDITNLMDGYVLPENNGG